MFRLRSSARSLGLSLWTFRKAIISRLPSATFSEPTLNPRSERDGQTRPAAAPRLPILKCEHAAVRLRDLPAEDQADARAAGLRRKERDEEVGGVGEARRHGR